MNVFVIGLRRSGTTILYDALSEDPGLRCFYEPLREDSATIGGGSGVRNVDLSGETRELRERFRRDRFDGLQIELFNWGGPRAPELELEPDLPDHVTELLAHLLTQGPDVAIKETRLHHKLGALAEIDPEAAVVHLVRDPRAVTASMLLGRMRRTDVYPDAETFFTARTGRRLWSSRRISEDLIARRRSLDLPADIPDFLRPLLVWKSAFETTSGDGPRLFGDRYALVRLEDLRTDPHGQLELIYGLTGRPTARGGRRVGGGERAEGRRDPPRRRRPLGARSPAPGDGAGAARCGLCRDPRPRAGARGAARPDAARAALAAGRLHRAGSAARLRALIAPPAVAGRSTRLRRVKARVLIRPKEGILDPQGKAVERALPALGFEGISHVRVGRMVELEAEDGADLARLCEQLLANPLIEDYEIER